MGCCQTKPQYSRDFILDSKRRQKVYGLTIENIENFWKSQNFKIYTHNFYLHNPDKSLLIDDKKPVPNCYIDAWNTWKRCQTNTQQYKDLPYPNQQNNPYYPDMFSEIVDRLCKRSLFCQPEIPTTHYHKHFNTIKNFYLTNVEQKHYLNQHKTLDDYVNSLLDFNEFHQLVKTINQTYSPKIPTEFTTKILI